MPDAASFTPNAGCGSYAALILSAAASRGSGGERSRRWAHRFWVGIVREEREISDMGGGDSHALDSHGFEIDLARLNSALQRVSTTSLDQMHGQRDAENDQEECTNDDEKEGPEGGDAGIVLEGEFGPYAYIILGVGAVEIVDFLAVGDIGDMT